MFSKYFWEEYSWGYPPLYYVVFGLSLSISCRGIIPHRHCHPGTCSIYHALISLSFTSFSLVLSFGIRRKNMLCLPKIRCGCGAKRKMGTYSSNQNLVSLTIGISVPKFRALQYTPSSILQCPSKAFINLSQCS